MGMSGADSNIASSFRLPTIGRVIEQMQEIRSTPRFLKGPHSQIREQFPSFVSDVEKVLRHRAGIAVEQFRVGGQNRRGT